MRHAKKRIGGAQRWRLAWVLVLSVGWGLAGLRPVVGQSWRVAAQAGVMHAGGDFTAVRPNGKTITSDIDAGHYLAAQVERRLGPRWGWSLGYEASFGRTFSIVQHFPDDTRFRSADVFDYQAITLGPVWHFRAGAAVGWGVEVYGSWAWFDDVSLAGAGPPYDRTAPIDLDVASRFGLGVAAHVGTEVAGSGWHVMGRGGLTIQRFQGVFPDDPALPGSGGDVDTALNPLYLSLGLSRDF